MNEWIHRFIDSSSFGARRQRRKPVNPPRCKSLRLAPLPACRGTSEEIPSTTSLLNGPSAKKVRSDFSHFLQGPPDRLFRQSVQNPSKTITFRAKVLFYLVARGCSAPAADICPGPSKPSCFTAFSLQYAHKPTPSHHINF